MAGELANRQARSRRAYNDDFTSVLHSDLLIMPIHNVYGPSQDFFPDTDQHAKFSGFPSHSLVTFSELK
jgi:hypothetical protein